MDKLTQYFKPVFSITYFVINLFKKLMFWRKGNSYREESLLPITVNSNKSATQFDYSSSSIVNSFNSNINGNWNLLNNRNQINQIKNPNENVEEEPNYFEDMNLTPSLTKQKKVIIDKKRVMAN